VEYTVNFLRHQSNEELLTLYKKQNPNYTDSLYVTNKLKIVIYTPPIDYSCGGVMVLHNLAKTLIDLRLPDTDIYLYAYDHTKYNNTFCNKFLNPFLVDDKTIVIYPEAIYGNPLNAKHIIRWILLDIGIDTPHSILDTWNKTDLVYHWEPSPFKNTKQLVNIWNNSNTQYLLNFNERSKTCYAYKKIPFVGNRLNSRPINPTHDKNSICIDNRDINEIIHIFNQCHTFHCYDPNTFYAIMAPLCGCVTAIYPVDNLTKEEYYKRRIIYKNEFYLDSGIAYGHDIQEIERARNSIKNINSDLQKLQNMYLKDLNNFVVDIYNYINKPELLTNTVYNIFYKEN
jgi:hypothetical protein